MVGLVDPSSLPPLLAPRGSPRSLDRYVPLNQLRASLRERWRFTPVHPSLLPHLAPPSATPFRARAAQTSCPPLPNGRRHRFLPLSLATSYSYGSALSVRSDSIFIVSPEVDCISAEIYRRRVNTHLFRGCEIDTHSGSRQSNLKGYQQQQHSGYRSRARG